MGWLFGTLGQAGLHMPRRFDLSGIVSLVMQILGLTYDRFRVILVRLIGERQVGVLERTLESVHVLVTQGIGAAWQKILEYATGLADTVIAAIRDWIAQSIVGAAITRLVSMFNPAGAIIQAIIAIYNTVQFFIERAEQIAAVAPAVFSSVGRIAAGDVGAAAAAYIEQTLARSIPVVLGFLARLMGLGNIADHIRNVVQRVQGVVEHALNRVARWVATRARSLLRGGRRQDARTGNSPAPPASHADRIDRARRELPVPIRGVLENGAPQARLQSQLAAWRVRFGLDRLFVDLSNRAQPRIIGQASPPQEIVRIISPDDDTNLLRAIHENWNDVRLASFRTLRLAGCAALTS